MGRIFILLLLFIVFLYIAPVRVAVRVRYDEKHFGVLCITLCGFYVYVRNLYLLRPKAGQYALGFCDKKGKLRNIVTIFPSDKKRKVKRKKTGEKLHDLFQRVHVCFVRVELNLHLDDAAHLAQVYGALCGAVNAAAVYFLRRQIPLQIGIKPKFGSGKTTLDAECMVCATMGKLVLSALGARIK